MISPHHLQEATEVTNNHPYSINIRFRKPSPANGYRIQLDMDGEEWTAKFIDDEDHNLPYHLPPSINPLALADTCMSVLASHLNIKEIREKKNSKEVEEMRTNFSKGWDLIAGNYDYK